MFKELKVNACFGERTGYQIHASRFFPELDKLVRNYAGGTGDVYISLLDTVSASQATERHPAPSILYNVWESTEQPQDFINKLQFYDQLWVPSEWQRAASISQGIPEEFVKVVPEGVDPEVYKPHDGFPSAEPENDTVFKFVHVGQWQPRKSTLEIIQAFLKAFPDTTKGRFPTLENANANVRLELSVDTLFPSDEFKTTEERLAHYGINDPRISVIHFEERGDYIRRLQSADVFVSCSRSEGWGLPIIEAMACGIPTIVADWGGSTEYAGDAIKVRVSKLIKPFGIYGNWDVPGQWCEPDYDHLAECMRDAFVNYKEHKEKALKTSDIIREKFSWKAAAQKAYTVLEELHSMIVPSLGIAEIDAEREIRDMAKAYGYEIEAMTKEPSVFVIGCWPDSPEKVDTLKETIRQVREFGYPVIISTHYIIPPDVSELVDYVIYEKKNVLSGDWKPTYYRNVRGQCEFKKCNIEYHAVACLNAMRNAVDFCRGKYKKLYYIEYDSEVDLRAFVRECRISPLPFTGIKYEGQWMRTDVWGADLDFVDRYIPTISSWDEYAARVADINAEYPLEQWLYKAFPKDKLNLVDIPVSNRYNQVDYNVWDDDVMECSFVDGPVLNIAGLSKREYDVGFYVGDKCAYSLRQKSGMWSKASSKYYLPWTIVASLNGEEKFRHTIDLKDKRVLIAMGSKALGDTIAWMPYIDEFRKAHNCHVVCATWWEEIFDYPELEFVKPGTVVNNLYAAYEVGCYDGQKDKNPTDWRTVPLQRVACDILGLAYEPIRAKLKCAPKETVKPYVCFSEYSTMQNKFWNRPYAWQNIVNHLNSIGYECVSISFEKTTLHDVTAHNGQGIHQTIKDIQNCAFYIGLNHGPSWLAYALGVPCIMITGVSEPWNDFPNPHRISVDSCRPGCFNDPSLPIDRKWDWCPRGKNYVCTGEITETVVIEEINKIIMGGDDHATKKGKKQKGREPEYQRADVFGKAAKAGGGDSVIQCGEA